MFFETFVISKKSIELKTINGTDTILIKLIIAVRDIESATSPSAQQQVLLTGLIVML